MVQKDHAICDPQRIVIRKRNHASAELDVPRLRGGVGDKDLRRRDDLHPARVVLAYPGFVVPELVEQLNGGQIACVRRGGILPRRGVEGCHEDAESHACHTQPQASRCLPAGTR